MMQILFEYVLAELHLYTMDMDTSQKLENGLELSSLLSVSDISTSLDNFCLKFIEGGRSG